MIVFGHGLVLIAGAEYGLVSAGGLADGGSAAGRFEEAGLIGQGGLAPAWLSTTKQPRRYSSMKR